MRRYEISRCGQDDRVGVVGRKAGGNEAIFHLHVVAARATQAADRPGIDDVALRGRAEHEPVLRRPCLRRSGLSILVHDAQEDEPGAQLTSAHQGPAPAHAIATIDDGGTSAWPGTVRQNHARIAKDELRDLPGEPGRGPVNIAVPDAPRDRCVGARELLVDINRLDRTQVETAIGGGEEDTEESGLASSCARSSGRRRSDSMRSRSARMRGRNALAVSRTLVASSPFAIAALPC